MHPNRNLDHYFNAQPNNIRETSNNAGNEESQHHERSSSSDFSSDSEDPIQNHDQSTAQRRKKDHSEKHIPADLKPLFSRVKSLILHRHNHPIDQYEMFMAS